MMKRMIGGRWWFVFVFALWVLPAGAASAQSPLPRTAQWDFALTYAAARTEHVTGQNFWLQGGAVEIHADLFQGLGIVASVTGLHCTSATPAVASLDFVTAVFGPRYTYRRRDRTSIFGEGLVGEADGFHSIFAYGSGPVGLTNGTTDSANSLALQTGGGVDIKVSKHLGIRVVQVDYLRTQLPNGGTSVQNNLRLSAGVVWRSGGSR